MASAVNTEVVRAQSAWFQDAKETSAVFAGIVAVVPGGIYCLLRWGFKDDSLAIVLQTLPLSLFLVSFSPLCRRVATALGVNPDRSWIGQDGVLSLVALAGIIGAGVAAGSLGIQTAYLWRLIGVVSFLLVFTCWLSNRRVLSTLAFLSVSLLFSLWVAGAVWGSGYQNPLYEEAVIGGYYLCKDLLSPAVVANMLKTYGAASFGVDGLVYSYYHWGSYWIFAQLSYLTKTSQMNFNQLCVPVIFIPFFLSRFVGFAIDIRKCLASEPCIIPLRADKWFWLVLFAAFIGFVPYPAAHKMAFGLDYQFISDSYLVVLGISFATLSMFTRFIEKGVPEARLALSDRVVICILSALLIGIGFVKVSLMFLLIVMLGYLVLRLRLWTHITISFALLVSLVAMVAVVKLTVAPGESGFHHIYPFGFFISNISFEWKPLWLLFYFFWSWIFVIWQLYAKHASTIGELFSALKDKRILAAEVVVIVCLVGSGPAMLFAIPGASGTYFMNFQTWLSAGLLLGYLSDLRQSTFSKRFREAAPRERLLNMPLYKVGMGLATIVLIWMLLTNGALAVWKMIDINIAIRCSLTAGAGAEICAEPFGSQAAKAAVSLRSMNPRPLINLFKDQVLPLIASSSAHMDKAEHWRIVDALKRLAEIPDSRKRATAVYVPRTNVLYWNLSPQCEVTPFFVPAITGMAMIDGLPARDCQPTGWAHHYSPFRMAREHADSPQEPTDGNICSRARAKGFSGVIVLDSDESGQVVTREVPCH